MCAAVSFIDVIPRVTTSMPAVRLSCCVVMLMFALVPARAGDDLATAADRMFFESKIRPLLSSHCFECHSGDRVKGGLRLDSAAEILRGGDSGPAAIPGDADGSLLVHAVRYEGPEMPPRRRLADHEVSLIAEWVRRGLPWPDDQQTASVRTAEAGQVTAEDRAYWAFQPVQVNPELNEIPQDGVIDILIDQRLQSEGLQASRRAEVSVLIRRAFLGLTGLPPTWDELQHWTKSITAAGADPLQEDAWDELVDELLQRPSYGEHWGRHWLDVVRYGQSNGYERDGYKPHIWRYRDYVVQSFLQDKPYDRFLLEQLAGDELPDSSAESRIATGFYRLGTWDDEPDDARQAEYDDLDDVLSTIGSAFMGLTIGCARCHEHKFDPIPQEDYYRMLAFVRNVRRYENPQDQLGNASVLPIAEDSEVLAIWRDVQRQQREHEQTLESASASERADLQKQAPDLQLSQLAYALGVRERGTDALPTQLLIRGNSGNPGPEVAPGFLQVLHTAAQPNEFASESPLRELLPSSGRRLVLARWLARAEHPLTARVLVNRVWHYHFGRGIVETTADFGVAGTPPSHPQLLDWLAADFVEHGWSIAHLHRRILRSRAWRRSSQVESQTAAQQRNLTLDPSNRLLWRGTLRRLEAESIRDRLLFSSGELNAQVGGREMYPRLSGEVLAGQSKPGLGWEVSTEEQQRRRSIYAVVKRGVRDPLLEAFDYSNVTSPLTERAVTTVAPQALMLLHGRFTAARADALATSLLHDARDPQDRLRMLYRRILQREPTSAERELSEQTLSALLQEELQTAGRITLRPDVPVSLFGGYRSALPGELFLQGPREGWRSFPGVWGGGYEGIDVVDAELGPFALREGVSLQNGLLRGRLLVDESVELLTLLTRSSSEGAAWSGNAVMFDRRSNGVFSRVRHQGKEERLERSLRLPGGTWLDFEWRLSDGESEFRLLQEEEVLLQMQWTTALTTAGQFGAAVWGGEVQLDKLFWLPEGKPEAADDPAAVDLVRERSVTRVHRDPPGWSRYGGDWRLTDAGDWHVSPDRGGKLVWETAGLSEGEFSVELKLTPGAAEIAGVLLCVSEPQIGADNWYGYEISLNHGRQTVFLGDHRHNYRMVAEAEADVRPGEWQQLRCCLRGDELLVYVDHAEQPQLQLTLQDRLSGTQVGLRTWGSDVEYRNLRLTRNGQELTAVWPAPETEQLPAQSDAAVAEQRAWAALCRVMFNLSEFVYVE